MPGSSSSPFTNCRAAFELISHMSYMLYSILFAYICHIMWACVLHDFIISFCESKLFEKNTTWVEKVGQRHSPSLITSSSLSLLSNGSAVEIVIARTNRRCTKAWNMVVCLIRVHWFSLVPMKPCMRGRTKEGSKSGEQILGSSRISRVLCASAVQDISLGSAFLYSCTSLQFYSWPYLRFFTYALQDTIQLNSARGTRCSTLQFI